MRPHKLTFAGIGTYPGEQTVDFDALDAHGLYLIVGPTGAGKTTVFDALTFALFGKVAGFRSERGLVSDHAERKSPYVRLEFSHGGLRYDVTRRLPVDGVPQRPADHLLVTYGPDGSEMTRVTATRTVTDAISGIIGLDAEQFMRVVLLPQNEFRRFLMDKSTEKQKVLRALFSTNLYERTAFRLEWNAKGLLKQAEERGRDLKEARDACSRLAEGLVADGLATDLPDTDEDLAGAIEAVEGLATRAADRAEALQKIRVAATETRAIAEAEVKRFDAAHELKELERERASNEKRESAAESAIADHERAKPVREPAERARKRGEDSARAEKAETESRKRVVAAANKLPGSVDIAASVTAAAPSASASEFSRQVDVSLGKANKALENHELAESLDGEIARETARAKKAETHRGSAEKKILAARTRLKTAKERLKSAEKSASQVEILQRKVDDLDEAIEEADVDAARSALVDSKEAYDKADRAFARADERLRLARDEQVAHLAGHLASALRKGEACPVCGSTEHPAKARKVAEVDIEALEETRDRVQRNRNELSRDLKESQKQVERAIEAKKSLPTPATQNKLRKSLDDALDAADSIDELAVTVEELDETIVDLDQEIKDLVATIRTAEGQVATHTKNRTAATKAGNAVVPAARAESLVASLESIRDLADDLQKAETAAATARRVSTEADSALREALDASGFDDEKSALPKILDTADLSAAKATVKRAGDRARAIDRLNGTVGDEPVPKVRPDVEVLLAAEEKSRADHDAAAEARTTLVNAVRELTARRKDIATIGPEAEALLSTAREAMDVAEIIKTGKGDRLALEKWVQRAIFEDVCEVASVQISRLSSGRYTLTLDGDGVKQRTRPAGLDLYVTDSHTGRTRSVESLSGGEQFLTSLALALALAEVVQRQSGGIEMSTLFIDEGFGSLDADTLEVAVEVLRSLQDTGRTVGVISHVESMQQELPVGIRVTRSPAGSSLEVTAPSI